MALGRLAGRVLAGVALAIASCAPAFAADPPRRIVSFNVCADQLVLALADPDQIVGLSPYAADPTISTEVDKARDFPRLGWQAESVIPLNPDMVLVGFEWDRSLTQRILRALGFRVHSVGVAPDLAAAYAQIRDTAALLGHPERGEVLIAQIEAARARLAAARQRAMSALLVGNGGYTAGPASLAVALMAEAGFVPPPGAPAGYGGYVPLEKLIVLHPDYLVVSSLIEQPDAQGAVYLTHPALLGLYPQARRIVLPSRYTLCGGPSLIAAFDYLTGIVTRLGGR
jgi:iron complex transport system substrate-binding protein